MATNEREALRRLVDDMPDEQVHTALEVMRQLAPPESELPTPRPRPSWVGSFSGDPDLSVRIKDILWDEFGKDSRDSG